MTRNKLTGKTAATSAISAELRSDSSDKSAWTRDIPPSREFAPGDALYETLEDFVFDQSEGEESGEDAEGFEKSGGGDLEQNKVSEDKGEDKEAAGLSSAENHNDGDNTDTQASQLPATTQRKRRRDAYTAAEDHVLYLLHTHVSVQHGTRVEIFNRVFHGKDVVREKGALVMQWFRMKNIYNKRFAKLSTAELAEHETWRQKIDNAMKDAGIASRSDGKHDDETDSADDQASQLGPPWQRRETRAR